MDTGKASDSNRDRGFETLAIHAGQAPDPVTGAVVPPIYQTSTFHQDGVGKPRGYEYSRIANPTRRALEECLAALEGARFGFGFASGMAAETAVMHLLRPGDHIVCPTDVYGGTYRLFAQVISDLGLTFTATDLTDLDQAQAAVRPETRMVWLESPTNPALKVLDLEVLAGLAHEAGAVCVVDNTFATPYLQRPLQLGADVVVHSATKYIGGHSDVIAGAVLTNDESIAERVGFALKATGSMASPFDCWLLLRGLKTLPVRMERHQLNAFLIAQMLQRHPTVERVIYPGLPSHPQYDLGHRQMKGPGGMIAFQVRGSDEEAVRVVEAAELFLLAESLGGVESLIEHPARMTHQSVAGTELAVPPNLIRLSVGLETADDLIADLERALSVLD